jgi:hypothetical protein
MKRQGRIRLTVRGNSSWMRKGNGWERPHHQVSRERQSACRNDLLQRPWDLGEAWRKESCSYLLSAVNGQIEDPELPKVGDVTLRLQTGQVVVQMIRPVKRSVPGLNAKGKGDTGRGEDVVEGNQRGRI